MKTEVIVIINAHCDSETKEVEITKGKEVKIIQDGQSLSMHIGDDRDFSVKEVEKG